jgi:hypothetical protein
MKNLNGHAQEKKLQQLSFLPSYLEKKNRRKKKFAQ